MAGRLPTLLACLALLAAPVPGRAQDPAATVARAARAQVGVTLSYAPAYTRIPYPNGDLPADRGVCTDVVVRAFRAAGIDLQAKVHEDMRANFNDYPRKWGLSRPDPNIDHRRVPNLQRWFARQGMVLPVSAKGADYRPGDVVSWKLPNGLDHIGIVSTLRSRDGERPMVVHNIGAGAQEEDVLFAWKQTGHFRGFAASTGARR